MRRVLLLAVLGVGAASAFTPGALAPGVPDLDDAEGRLRHTVGVSEAVGDAVSRMQSVWTTLPTSVGCEDAVRLQLGWRIERFGAAWREAAQAAIAQAGRTQRILGAPTVTPLIDSPWEKRVQTLAARATTQERAFRDASAWQNTFVRPTLAGCPLPEPLAHPGLPARALLAREDADLPAAVLAMGDGWVCPQRVRADGAIVLVEGGRACWAATDDCACEPVPVAAGAVVTPPVVSPPDPEPTAEVPAPVASEATPEPPKPKKKKKGPGPEKGPPAP